MDSEGQAVWGLGSPSRVSHILFLKEEEAEMPVRRPPHKRNDLRLGMTKQGKDLAETGPFLVVSADGGELD
jgi:hypothetical protein